MTHHSTLKLVETNPIVADSFVLKHANGPFGIRLGGVNAGPEMVVLGHGASAKAAFAKLKAVPTIGRMRGRLTLLELDTLPDLDSHTLAQIIDVPCVDHVLCLANDEPGVDPVSDGYWRVLEACAELGMISGRGIPRSYSVKLKLVS